MADFTTTHPEYLWFLLSIPLLIITHLFTLRHLKTKAWMFANFEAIQRVAGPKFDLRNSSRLSKNIMILLLKIVILTLLIFSAAGVTVWYTGQASDSNFVLAIDASSSMLADDYTPNRFEAAKQAALTFIESIEGKAKVGVVSFAGTSTIDLSLSDDRVLIREAIGDLTVKRSGGTDIGEALITAANVLATENKTGAILLLTDGRSTVGTSVADGAEYVQGLHYAIHTIGIGTAEGGRFLRLEAISRLDNATLIQLAAATDGRYFEAKNVDDLKAAFVEIAKTHQRKLPSNLQLPLLLSALALILLEWGLINTRYRTMP